MSAACSGGEERHSQMMVMFEEAVNKSFEIIKTMLPRLNSLYQLNEELERSVSNVERKLTKLELDNEDLHYELRTNKLAVETRISTIVAQYNTLANECSKRQAESSSKQKGRPVNQKKEEELESPGAKAGRQKDRTRKIIFEDEVVRRGEKKRSLKRKHSIELEEEQVGESKVHFNLDSHVSIEASEKKIGFNSDKTVIGSERNITRKGNMKPKTQQACNAKSSRSIRRRKEEKEPQSYASFLREIENYHFCNQKMKKNYEKLMDQYCQQSSAQFAALQQHISQITAKLQQMDPENNLLELIRKNSHLELTQSLQEFKSRLSNKLDASIFEGVFKELANRLGSAHESIRKLANKEETRRAIEHLENKLNFVLGEQLLPQRQNNQSIHTVDIDIKGGLKSASSSLDHSQHNSRQTLRPQRAENTPRTLRNDHKAKAKRIVTSLHSNIINAAQTEGRDKEGRLSLILEKCDKPEEGTVRVLRSSMMREREVNLLKQKSAAALEIGKTKLKPRLKKERLIFQYD